MSESADDQFDKYVKDKGGTQIGTPPQNVGELTGWMRSKIPLIASIGAIYFTLWRIGLFDLPD